MYSVESMSTDLAHFELEVNKLEILQQLKGSQLLARVDAKLLQIMPKLEILLDKAKVKFNNNNNKRKRFWLLNFPRTAILDLMMSLHCLYCWKTKVLLFETTGQRSDVMKSKMAAGRKLKT